MKRQLLSSTNKLGSTASPPPKSQTKERPMTRHTLEAAARLPERACFLHPTWEVGTDTGIPTATAYHKNKHHCNTTSDNAQGNFAN